MPLMALPLIPFCLVGLMLVVLLDQNSTHREP